MDGLARFDRTVPGGSSFSRSHTNTRQTAKGRREHDRGANRKLADSLRAKLEKVATREKELVDAALVRVGDEVEVISFSTWYPGTVKKISPTGAVVSYTDSFGKQEKEVEYAKMRYPNGEGPWTDWIDSTGNHRIKARYITHDETHVELLAESGKRIRLAREKLAESIESQLALRPILTRRPDEVDFDMSKVDYSNIPSWTDFGSKSPEVLSTSLSLEAASPDPTIHEMTMTSIPNNLGSIDLVVAAGGDEGWIALGTSPAKDGPKQPASLHWFSTKSRTLQPGPKFFEGEILLGYSPSQNRLLTAEGLDLSGSATRFCTYRLSRATKQPKPNGNGRCQSYPSSRRRMISRPDLSAKIESSSATAPRSPSST